MKWLFILIVLLIYGNSISQQQLHNIPVAKAQQTTKVIAKVAKVDERASRIASYLVKRGSPMAQESIFFVKAADMYHLDYRLLPAISGVESGFETAGNLFDFNPFGYMCGSSPCVFSSYSEAIDKVAKTISRGNAYKRYQQSRSIIDLAYVYCQVHPEEWSAKVQYFIDKL